jgi:hypothetical protein
MAKAQQYRVDPLMAGMLMPSASNPTRGVMSVAGNMTQVYARRRLMKQAAAQGRQRPGRVTPPPPPMKLVRY